MKKLVITSFLLLFGMVTFCQYHAQGWKQLSTVNGDIPIVNKGTQQTSSIVLDVDNDGINEFFITERTEAPSVVMYKFVDNKWNSFIIDNELVKVEAGGTTWDVDNDGDLDVIFGGEGRSNQVWWWENPYPSYDVAIPWKRHFIKNSGAKKQHDQLFGDFDGDGKGELVFWNQRGLQLILAEIPEDPGNSQEWEYFTIYEYGEDSQMYQRGNEDAPPFKKVNEHEGLAKADIDLDGIEDIVGGGSWFKFKEGHKYVQNVVDGSYTFTRCIAGQFIEGGRPEVVMVTGEGKAPMVLYEWKKGAWYPKIILDEVIDGHSLEAVDFNNDGKLDIFNAEMRLNNGNPDAKCRILLGDGNGNFKDSVITTGFGNHQSHIADMDGDGDLDILAKPYNWETPRIDIWINNLTNQKINEQNN